MKQINQYSTPRERVGADLRTILEAQRFPAYAAAPAKAATGGTAWDPDSFPLAMVYAPESTFSNIYGDEEGLDRGTIFSDLYFPFECSSCRGNGGASR